LECSLGAGEETATPHGHGNAGASIADVQPQMLRIFALKATSTGRSWEGVHINEFDAVKIEDLLSPPRDHVKARHNPARRHSNRAA
jgi:hypothetical protein